jgi:hypothetical protein
MPSSGRPEKPQQLDWGLAAVLLDLTPSPTNAQRHSAWWRWFTGRLPTALASGRGSGAFVLERFCFNGSSIKPGAGEGAGAGGVPAPDSTGSPTMIFNSSRPMR